MHFCAEKAHHMIFNLFLNRFFKLSVDLTKIQLHLTIFSFLRNDLYWYAELLSLLARNMRHNNNF